MSAMKLARIVLTFAFVAAAGPAMAQTRSALKPSPELFAADMYRLIQGLKAEGANERAVASAEAMYSHARETGLAGELSPDMQSFIQAQSTRDAETGKSLLEKMSPFDLGVAAYVLHNYSLAQKYWLALAQAGDVAAQVDVGLMYSNGQNGATQSDAETFKWYRQAATHGNEVAQENVATLYSEGRGVSKSPTQAYMWLSLAARQAVDDGHTASSVSLVRQRDKLAANLDPQVVDQALALAGRCAESQYRDCE